MGRQINIKWDKINYHIFIYKSYEFKITDNPHPDKECCYNLKKEKKKLECFTLNFQTIIKYGIAGCKF